MYKKLIISCCLLFSTHAVAQKQALLIGVSDYGGDPRNDLPGINLDINKMKQLLISWGFNTKVLYNQESLEMEDYLKSYANSLNANDTFAFYYTGHGSYVADTNGDEVDDHRDEALVLSDGVRNIPYIDDHLNHYLSAISAKKLVMFDSCHSGTANRGEDSSLGRAKSFPSNALDAPLSKGLSMGGEIEGGDYIILSASKDSEESLATASGSLFTNEIYRLLQRQTSLESMREEATYNIVSYAKKIRKKPHHPKFTYSNPSFGNRSIGSFLKTASAQIPRVIETLQTKLDSLVANPQITKINITNKQNSYNTNDFITFGLDTNGKQGYLTILFVENDKVSVLYPNPKAFSKVIGGRYVFPRDFGNFKVRAFKNCNGCQKDKTSIYMMLTPQPIPNIQNMTNQKILSFAKGSTTDMAISKDVDLVFDEPNKTPSSGMMVGKYEFFVY
jgi:hypothetical protein